jgi:hypothetical protein
MEKGILDVELVHGPTPGDSQSQHSSNSGRLNNGAEGLIVVHSGGAERSREPSALSLCLKIHLSVTTLAPEGRETKSHVLLDSKASYSSCIA